jgi:hypothetical protein
MCSNWYILCVLCRVGVKITPTLPAASRHNTHKNIPIAVHTVPPDDEQKSSGNMWRLLIETN